jgi:hypothetical protein
MICRDHINAPKGFQSFQWPYYCVHLLCLGYLIWVASCLNKFIEGLLITTNSNCPCEALIDGIGFPLQATINQYFQQLSLFQCFRVLPHPCDLWKWRAMCKHLWSSTIMSWRAKGDLSSLIFLLDVLIVPYFFKFALCFEMDQQAYL